MDQAIRATPTIGRRLSTIVSPRTSEAGASLLDRIVINGRFMSQPISGVQRFAREMVLALDDALVRRNGAGFGEVEIHMPSEPSEPLELEVVRPVVIGGRSGHAWEQLDLWRSAHGAILVNLANSAPLAHRRQIVTVHDAALRACPGNFTTAYRMWYRALYGGLRLTSARFVTVSDFSAGDISKHFAIPPGRISVIPNGADHFDRTVSRDEILARHDLEPLRYIVAIGGLSARKNLRAAEAAVSMMSGDRPKLVVVGRRDTRVYSAFADRFGADVVEVGYLDDGEIKALYQTALCLVYPSLYEGFGLPPVEAMRSGCPVVVSNTTSLPEVCGDAALYCDPQDPLGIARQIEKIRDDAALRRHLVARGHERTALFAWEEGATRLLELIAKVAGAPDHVR
ncbi:MAG: glycosyl transferase, group 1 family protein [Rhodospirillales bacterium]|nr:glycosyl transferase, group 1 family protein [Rhodospirillales bacterium]